MQTKETREKREEKIPANWIHCIFTMSQTGGIVEKRVRPFLKAQRDSREEHKIKKYTEI